MKIFKKTLFPLLLILAFAGVCSANDVMNFLPRDYADEGIHKVWLAEEELLPVYDRLLELMVLSEEQRSKTRSNASMLIRTGNRQKLPEMFGALIDEQDASVNRRLFIGNFCAQELHKYFDSFEDSVRFLGGLLAGYKKSSVIVVSYSGTEHVKAFVSPQNPWDFADGKGNGRIYKGSFAYFIPFTAGAKFTVSVFGKKGDEIAKMWKVTPAGIRKKEWPGGYWEREVSVTK